MSWLQLLLLIRRLPIRELLAYPTDIRDQAAVRNWLVSVSAAFKVLADMTSTTIDDQLVNGLNVILADEENFTAVYTLVLMLIDGFSENDKEFQERLTYAAGVYKFNPMLIIGIVQLVVTLLKFIRERRNG